MNITHSIESLASRTTRTELRDAVFGSNSRLSVAQARLLTDKAATLSPVQMPLRLGIVHTYTSALLDTWLGLAGSLEGFNVDIYHAPYGTTIQEAQSGSGLMEFSPDITLLLLKQEDIHPELNNPLSILSDGAIENVFDEALSRTVSLLQEFRRAGSGHLLVSFLPKIIGAGLGDYDSLSARSERGFWSRFKSALAAAIRTSIESTSLLDLDLLLEDIGRRDFFDRKYWYSSSYPFSAMASIELARRVVNVGVSLKYPKVKVIVFDADNTLWGGVVGEDGLNGIALGPEYPGNTYVEFQRRILALRQRGFVLALCSKNNQAEVDKVFAEHPHQVLKPEHFVAQRVNWLPKSENLVSIAKELNIGLESFVFVDDSDYECAHIRHALPEVEIVQTPAKPLDVPSCLDKVARLEVLSITEEDRTKTEMYAQESGRRELKKSLQNQPDGLEGYLRSLEMAVHVRVDDDSQLVRIAQLTQKTNQFNLTTRRYIEAEIAEFIRAEDSLVAFFSLTDIFGDSGIVGVAIVSNIVADSASLDTFLMSCRVIGRGAENVFLETLLGILTKKGVIEVLAEYRPTEKNGLVKDFLCSNGFINRNGNRYSRNLRTHPAVATFPLFSDVITTK